MSIDHTNIKLYLEKWIETATNGNAEIEFAWFVNRMMLVCTICKQTLTAPLPKDQTDIDYSVQEFIKIHSHTGAHHSGCTCIACTKTTAFPKDAWGQVPVTADFKKLPAMQPLPVSTSNEDDFGLTNLPKAAKTKSDGYIPPNYDKDAKMIAAQLAKFKSEYAQKDAETAAKIKQLQSEDLTLSQQQMLEDMKNQNKIAIEVLKAQGGDKVADQAVKNAEKLLKFQELKAMLDSPIGQAILKGSSLGSIIKPAGPAPTPEPVKKSPVKKDITGRKVR